MESVCPGFLSTDSFLSANILPEIYRHSNKVSHCGNADWKKKNLGLKEKRM